jgi:hypothetical protein
LFIITIVQFEDAFSLKLLGLEAIHRIWQTGSFESMKRIFFGGVPLSDDKPYLDMFATWTIQAEIISFIVAAGMSRSEKLREVGRYWAIGTAIVDMVRRVLAVIISLDNNDDGAILGLVYHTVLTAIMFVLAKYIVVIFNKLNKFIGSFGTGGD